MVHLGGVSTEQPFEPILQANIVGVYNLYEAARQHGVKRIVFASSNHVTGFYRQDEVIEPAGSGAARRLSTASARPSARTCRASTSTATASRRACLRIGSSFPEPKDRRMLATWLSYDDLERLVVACLTTPVLGHTIVYGMSDNTNVLVGQHARRATSASGRRTAPSGSAPRSRRAQPTLDLNDPAAIYQGGAFVRIGPFE